MPGYRGAAPNMDKIIITVPHCECAYPFTKSQAGRICDTRARKSAEILNDEIKLYFKNVSVFYSNLLRTLMDGNRYESRQSAFRTGIREDIKETMENGKIPLVLDVHSFPNTEKSFGLTSYGKIPKIVFITPDQYFYRLRKFSKNFADVLVFSTVTTNDILQEASELGSSGILIEFNEDENYFTANEQIEFIRKFNTFLFRGVSQNDGNIELEIFLDSRLFLGILIILALVIIYYFVNIFYNNNYIGEQNEQ